MSPIEHKEVDVVYEGGPTLVITDGCLSVTRRRRSAVGRKNRVGGLFNLPCDTFSASSWLFNLHARDSIISIFCSRQGERTWSAARCPKSDMRRSKSVRAREDMALTKAAAWAWHQRATPGRLVQPFETRAAAAAPKQRRPSRHKLEADAAAARSTSQPPLTRSGSVSLLDGYEIRRISLDIDIHIVEARRFREQLAQQPKRRHERPTKSLARRVAGFFSWWSM